MTDDDDDDRLDALLLLYVADVADPDERAAVHAYLASGDPVAAGRLAEAGATFAAVGLGADPVRPAPALRRRALDGLAAPARRRSWRHRLAVPAVAATVAATFAVVLVRPPALLWPTTARPDRAIAALQQQLRERDRTIADLRGRVDQQRSVVDAMLRSSAEVVRLASQPSQPNASAWLVRDRSAADRWVLVATRLIPPPPGKTYELWYVTAAGRKVRADTFDVAPDGSAAVQGRVPPGLGPLALAAVTDEPAGGTDSPTGQFQLLAKLP